MEMIPLISGSKAGPLGVMQLPRVWLKLRLHALGLLPEGYVHGNGGDDAALFEALGIDGPAFRAYVAAAAPDYLACEAWVRANAARATPASIAAFNARLASLVMPEPRRTEWVARFGLEGRGFDTAVGLNQLDDWDAIHRQLLDAGAPDTPVVPAISSSSLGPLGVPHLARLWLKHRLYGAGRLAPGYRHGEGGFDELTTDAIGLDRSAFAAYVETERPDYLTAEAWVRRGATALDPAGVAAFSATLADANFPAARLPERHAELGISDSAFTNGIALNDLDDWLGLHRQLSAAR